MDMSLSTSALAVFCAWVRYKDEADRSNDDRLTNCLSYRGVSQEKQRIVSSACTAT
jgi:hypothetical protein